MRPVVAPHRATARAPAHSTEQVDEERKIVEEVKLRGKKEGGFPMGMCSAKNEWLLEPVKMNDILQNRNKREMKKLQTSVIDLWLVFTTLK